MKIGLIGLPNSGKTTIFNALTKREDSVATYSYTKVEPKVAVVDVDDDRLVLLSDMYKPKKTTRATIEIINFPGTKEGSARGGLLSGNFLTWIKNADALALVVRNFNDNLTGDTTTPLRDIDEVDT